MKKYLMILALIPLYSYASDIECFAKGKLKSQPLTRSGPAQVTTLEGLTYTVEETGNILTLAIYDEDGVGARSEYALSNITHKNHAKLSLLYPNGEPHLTCARVEKTSK